MYYTKYHKDIVWFAKKCVAVKKLQVLTFIKERLVDAVTYEGQYFTLTTSCMIKYFHIQTTNLLTNFGTHSTDTVLINWLKLPSIIKCLEMTTKNKRHTSYDHLMGPTLWWRTCVSRTKGYASGIYSLLPVWSYTKQTSGHEAD